MPLRPPIHSFVPYEPSRVELIRSGRVSLWLTLDQPKPRKITLGDSKPTKKSSGRLPALPNLDRLPPETRQMILATLSKMKK